MYTLVHFSRVQLSRVESSRELQQVNAVSLFVRCFFFAFPISFLIWSWFNLQLLVSRFSCVHYFMLFYGHSVKLISVRWHWKSNLSVRLVFSFLFLLTVSIKFSEFNSVRERFLSLSLWGFSNGWVSKVWNVRESWKFNWFPMASVGWNCVMCGT